MLAAKNLADDHRVNENLNDQCDDDGVNEPGTKNARVHQEQLEIEHRPEYEKGELRAVGPEERKIGGHKRIGLAAQAEQNGDSHHQQDRDRQVLAQRFLNVAFSNDKFSAGGQH